MREYHNEDIEKILKRTFEIAVKDSEWEIRHLAEWNILFEGIDKTLEYVNGGKVGKLFLNPNMWYVLNDALASVLALYDLKLIGSKKTTECEEVVPINYLYHIDGDGFEVALKYRDKQCTIEDLKRIYEREIIDCIHNNENDETIQNAWCKELVDLINNKLNCEHIIKNLRDMNYIISKVGSEDKMSLRKELEKLDNEIFDLAHNHGKHYLTFITNDITRDLEDGTIDEMEYEELKKYVEDIKTRMSEEV